MIRFGLCCIFRNEQIKFRNTTAKSLKKLDYSTRINKLSEICLNNLKNLKEALKIINSLNIKAFRVLSPIFPLYTHPEAGYHIDELNKTEEIYSTLKEIKIYKQNNDIRLSFHPDQFIIISSPNQNVVINSINEIEYQTTIASLIDADVINIHMGGVYEGKQETTKRFKENFGKLSDKAKERLTLENDDKLYTPSDLIPLCNEMNIPFVYDVHHHRCNRDKISIEKTTEKTFSTWMSREPYLHISSPKYGWNSKNPKSHSDYIDSKDFPNIWETYSENFTLDIEAKAKELAVKTLMNDLNYGRKN